MNKYHSQKIDACLSDLKSSLNGLSMVEAEKRLKKEGFNEFAEEKEISKLLILFSQFNSALVYILLLAGVISLILKDYIDAYVIFAAVLINIIIGYIQENKANQAIRKLKKLVEHKAIVLRDGREIKIDSRLLARGDIIILSAGNRVPADARLIEAVDLSVNESMLTGESMPSAKDTNELPPGAALADRENMVYAGTMALSGRGRAVITSVGQETEMGKIAEMVKSTKEVKTPLQERLSKFGRLLGLLFGSISLFIVSIGLLQGRSFVEMMNTGVAVGVAAIPEGLIVAVTVILTIGMQQILRQKALTRKLVAAETLGSTSVICTDKTGTLTEGKMHVAHIIIGEKEFEFKSLGSRQDEKEAKAVSLALQTAMMCNDAVIENQEDELASWRVIGSPTEAALLSAAVQSGLRKDKLLKIEPRIAESSFDSQKKYMLSLHKRDKSAYVLYEKGAPEILLDKSTKFYHHGKEVFLSKDKKNKLIKNNEKLTSQGLRVIALAYRDFKEIPELSKSEPGKIEWEKLDNNLTFIGFIAIKDPLRPEAKETIALASQAGIRTVIITGDHKLTALAIAREIGLNISEENIIVGNDLDKISDEELRKEIKKINIYARVSPHHKLRIVKTLRESGEVVAMTGDGINDSPALKAADIGISLGTGTDVAKETSDIVLLDNNFKTIVSAVRQGRIIFKNIRKVIAFLLSDSFSEMTLIVGSLFFNAPLALLPAQILWINIINDGLPDFALAMEKGDDSVMAEKPISKNEPLLNKEMKKIIFAAGLFRDASIFALFFFLWHSGYDINYLRTLLFAILGLKSLMAIFSLRAFRRPIWRINPLSNLYLLGAVFISLSLLILAIYCPPLQKVLSTVALKKETWLLIIGVGFFGILLIELAKRAQVAEFNKKRFKYGG